MVGEIARLRSVRSFHVDLPHDDEVGVARVDRKAMEGITGDAPHLEPVQAFAPGNGLEGGPCLPGVGFGALQLLAREFLPGGHG